MEKSDRLIKKLLVLISVLLAVILVVNFSISLDTSLSSTTTETYVASDGTTATTQITTHGQKAAILSQVVCNNGTTWCTKAPKGWPKGVVWPPRDMTGNCELCTTTMKAKKITAANDAIITLLKDIPTCPLPNDNYCIKCGAFAWPPQIVKMTSCPYP
jgi:hypothetical protein